VGAVIEVEVVAAAGDAAGGAAVAEAQLTARSEVAMSPAATAQGLRTLVSPLWEQVVGCGLFRRERFAVGFRLV